MQNYRKLSIFVGIFLCAVLGFTEIRSTPITVVQKTSLPIKFIVGVHDDNNIIYVATPSKIARTMHEDGHIVQFEGKELQALYAEVQQRVPANKPLYFALLWQPDADNRNVKSRYNKDTWFMLPKLKYNDQIELLVDVIWTGPFNSFLLGNWVYDWRDDSFEALKAKARDKRIQIIKTDDIYKVMRLPKGDYTKDCNPGLCTYYSTEQMLACTCTKSGITPFVKAELKPVKLTDTVNYDRNTGKLSLVAHN